MTVRSLVALSSTELSPDDNRDQKWSWTKHFEVEKKGGEGLKGRRRRRKSGQSLAGSARPPRWLRLVAESDRLSSSLIRTTFLFYTFFATTVTAIQVYVSYSSRLDETVENITRLTQQIAPSLAQAVWEFNDPQIAAVMKIVEEQGAVESVALFNATGEALYPTKESSGKEAH